LEKNQNRIKKKREKMFDQNSYCTLSKISSLKQKI
jgi:hypothetical protein